jgi:Flp pilus assembly pilin Flp
MTVLFLRCWLAVHDGIDRLGRLDRIERDERGQTTAEYALVLIAAAAVAGLVLAWASKTHAISGLFDKLVGKITDMVT